MENVIGFSLCEAIAISNRYWSLLMEDKICIACLENIVAAFVKIMNVEEYICRECVDDFESEVLDVAAWKSQYL